MRTLQHQPQVKPKHFDVLEAISLTPVSIVKTTDLLKVITSLFSTVQKNQNQLGNLIQIDLIYGHGYFNIVWVTHSGYWLVKYGTREGEVLLDDTNMFTQYMLPQKISNTNRLLYEVSQLFENGLVWSVTLTNYSFTEGDVKIQCYEPLN